MGRVSDNPFCSTTTQHLPAHTFLTLASLGTFRPGLRNDLSGRSFLVVHTAGQVHRCTRESRYERNNVCFLRSGWGQCLKLATDSKRTSRPNSQSIASSLPPRGWDLAALQHLCDLNAAMIRGPYFTCAVGLFLVWMLLVVCSSCSCSWHW